MRQVAGRLRLDLAQFRELAAFAQFGSDLDRATRAQLERGLRIQEILKQPQYRPMAVEQQVMILWAVTNGLLDDVPIEKARDWEDAFHNFMTNNHPEIGQAIRTERQLTDDAIAKLRSAIEEFKKTLPM